MDKKQRCNYRPNPLDEVRLRDFVGFGRSGAGVVGVRLGASFPGRLVNRYREISGGDEGTAAVEVDHDALVT